MGERGAEVPLPDDHQQHHETQQQLAHGLQHGAQDQADGQPDGRQRQGQEEPGDARPLRPAPIETRDLHTEGLPGGGGQQRGRGALAREEGRTGPAGQHGDEGQRHHQGGEKGDHHRESEIAEGLSGDALDEDHRQEDGDRGEGRGDDRHADLARAPHRGLGHAVPFLAAAEDRLEDDDRGVDQHPDAQGQPAEGHDVEAHPEELQRGEGDDQGDGDAHRDDGSALEAPQEEEQDQDGQETADDGGVADLVDAAFDEERPVGHNFEDDPLAAVELLDEAGGLVELGLLLVILRLGLHLGGRGAGVEVAQAVLDPPGEGDDVGVGLLEDLELDALPPVGAGGDLPLLVRPHDLTKIPDPDLATLAGGHDRVLHLLEVLVLVEGADHVLGAPLGEGPAGDVDVLLAQAIDDVLYGEARAPELLVVEEDMDLLLEATAHPHRGHALDGFEGALDLQLGDPSNPPQLRLVGLGAGPAGEAQLHDRVERGVEAEDQGSLGLVGEEDEVELLEGVLDALRHLDAPGELEDDVGDAGPADARDAAQPPDHAQGLLDRSGDVVLDLLGGGTRVLRPHRQGRVGHLRHQVDGEPPVREVAEDDRGQEDHRYGHRTRGEEAALILHRAIHWIRSGAKRLGRETGRGVISRPWHRPASRPRRRRSSRGRRAAGPDRCP